MTSFVVFASECLGLLHEEKRGKGRRKGRKKGVA
jgi:hypothetical protein